jgi:multiple sugar transport system permease protein
MALPFYWMATSSVKTRQEATRFPPTFVPGLERGEDWDERGALTNLLAGTGQLFTAGYWTDQLAWDNYPHAWQLRTSPDNPPAEPNFSRYFFNSTFVAVVVTIGALITSSLAAFALATLVFWGRGFYFFLIIAILYIPGQILLIPNYRFFSELSALTLFGYPIGDHIGLNTYFVLIVPWLASVFSIFLLRQSFMTLPRDLSDAATIDGAGRMRYLFAVVLPLSKPTLITAGIFSFLGTWNSLLWPLIMVSDEKLYTVEVGLQHFRTEAGSEFHLLMAASTFSILPVIIMFFFLQRYFIAGIARSGLK